MGVAKQLIRKTTKRSKTLNKISSLVTRIYDQRKESREFRSRIRKIDIDKHLDVSHKPDTNTIILIVDCLRNSHMSYNGYARETTPFLDSLKASRFVGVSASSWTYPSVASILTGFYPHNHGAFITGKTKYFEKVESFRGMRKDVLTLPEALYLLGYRTYFGTAIDTAYYPLKTRTLPNACAPLSSEELIADSEKWIRMQGEPFFAYLHLGDTHEPLTPPAKFRDFFGRVKDIPNITRWAFRRPEEQEGKEYEEYKENRILLYDNTLRYVDHNIRKLCGFLEDSGIMDSTILVITGDHGEEFWEHAELEAKNFFDPRGYYGVGHGHNVFSEIINVPILVASGATMPREKRVKMVSAVDVMPTIVDLLGIRFRYAFDGRSLFGKEDDNPLLCEASGYGYEKKALVLGRYKLVHSQDDGIEWVFDLENDPEEKHPITDKEIVSILANRLRRLLVKEDLRKVGEIR